MKTTIALLSLALASAFSASADPFTFSYAMSDAPLSEWGTGRYDIYDVAVFVNDPALVGSKVTGVRVPLADSRGTMKPEASVWLCDKLRLDSEGVANRPKYGSFDVTITDNQIVYDFAEPMTIPEGGIYVGYTVEVTDLVNWTQRYPHILADGGKEGGLWVHNRKKYTTWTDLSATLNKVSAMQVIIDSPRSAAQVAVSLPEKCYSKVGETSECYVTLTNHGTEPVNTIEYTLSVDGKTIPGSYTFSPAIPSDFGAQGDMRIELPALAAVADYEMTFTVEMVNGKDNTDIQKSAGSLYAALDFMPVNRPVIEEYTGFWCKGCPSGYVALLEMHDIYGEELTAISIHNKDRIAAVPVSNYPYHIPEYPGFYINRERVLGSYSPKAVYEQERRKMAKAEVGVQAYWTDDTKSEVAVNATARFVDDDPEADYRFSYCLLHDGMSDPEWKQSNSYYGDTSLTGPYWDMFVNGGAEVSGLVYDDVPMIYHTMARGVEQSIPSDVKRGEIYSHEYTFSLKDAVNKEPTNANYGKYLIQDTDKLRVAVMVFDNKTGAFVNSTTTGYIASSGVEALPSESEIVSCEYYDLTGARLQAEPSKGVFIRLSRNADGSVKSEKICH